MMSREDAVGSEDEDALSKGSLSINREPCRVLLDAESPTHHGFPGCAKWKWRPLMCLGSQAFVVITKQLLQDPPCVCDITASMFLLHVLSTPLTTRYVRPTPLQDQLPRGEKRKRVDIIDHPPVILFRLLLRGQRWSRHASWLVALMNPRTSTAGHDAMGSQIRLPQFKTGNNDDSMPLPKYIICPPLTLSDRIAPRKPPRKRQRWRR